MIEIYNPSFCTVQAQGYYLARGDGENRPEFAHCFCGPHDVAGAMCPNCRKPLLRILAIDTMDPRLGLAACPFPCLSLFFCLTCEIGLHEFYYQLLPPDGGVRLLRYAEGQLLPEHAPFYPEPYPEYFPILPVHLVSLTLAQQWYIVQERKLFKAYASAKEAPRTPFNAPLAYEIEVAAFRLWNGFRRFVSYGEYQFEDSV